MTDRRTSCLSATSHAVGRAVLESASPGFQPGAIPSQLPTQTKKPDVVVTPGSWYFSGKVRPDVTCAMDRTGAYSPNDRRSPVHPRCSQLSRFGIHGSFSSTGQLDENCLHVFYRIDSIWGGRPAHRANRESRRPRRGGGEEVRMFHRQPDRTAPAHREPGDDPPFPIGPCAIGPIDQRDQFTIRIIVSGQRLRCGVNNNPLFHGVDYSYPYPCERGILLSSCGTSGTLGGLARCDMAANVLLTRPEASLCSANPGVPATRERIYKPERRHAPKYREPAEIKLPIRCLEQDRDRGCCRREAVGCA